MDEEANLRWILTETAGDEIEEERRPSGANLEGRWVADGCRSEHGLQGKGGTGEDDGQGSRGHTSIGALR